MIGSVSGITIPDDHDLRRAPPKRCEVKQDRFWERYDSKTLIYDCLYLPDLNVVRLYLPKPLNLEPLLKSAHFYLDGLPAPIRRWQKDRHLDQIDLIAPAEPSELKVDIDGFSATADVQRTDNDLRGMNVLYTNSKNNDLRWIKDWALFHARHQRANAVVVSDNASDEYTPDEVLSELSSIPELRAVKVTSHPYKFGPLGDDCTNQADGKFMQSCMMTAFRDRYMRNARAILNMDVDELCVRHSDKNIFDATCQSWAGHITFLGQWHYSQSMTDRSVHADHVLIDPTEPACPTKYAVSPQKLLGKRTMRVHQLGKVNRRLFQDRTRFSYLHCKQISNSWKVDRTQNSKDGYKVNEISQRALQSVFQTVAAS